MTRSSLFAWLALCAVPALSQTVNEPLGGADRHELDMADRRYLFGTWGGVRSRLEERGVNFDIQYVSDTLWNFKSARPGRAAMWNRVRGTVDIDLGTLMQADGWYFHATALWQAGGNLGAYLGLISSPSGIASADTFRLDSWWLEKRWRSDRIVLRAGQFAGMDFYGAQHYAASFVFEPMGYALDNLFNTRQSFDPPSTPAAEVRISPLRHLYVKSMVLGAESDPYAHNPTGLVPQFRENAMSVSEIGFTPEKKASSMRAFDNVESRKGYSGLYQFGAAYNPAAFTNSTGTRARSGNYLLYWMATQALWRVDREQSRGLDATAALDWSPADVNLNNRALTAGLRFNEPLPVRFHNTISFGYVRNSLSSRFSPAPGLAWRPENGFELNALLQVTHMMLFQPVIQLFENAGGGSGRAMVVGFRTKVEL
jgi:carbohydrate-selective porin OprB